MYDVIFILSFTLLFLLLLAAKPQKGPQPLRTAALHITLCGAAILLLSQSVNAYPLYILRSFQAVHVVQHLVLDFLLGVVIENTVTTDDLLPLAEQGKEPPKEVTPEPEPKPTEPVEEVPEPEPEKKDSPLLSLLLIGAVVLAGGGIGYYFKIYKPKHEAPDLEDDYCEYEDGELEEIAEEPEDEDTPPWEEDTEE